MATQTKLVTFADGREVRLTIGEINAIKAYVKVNGKEGSGPQGIQYEPGGVKYSTVRNLRDKGVFESAGNGCVRFAPGVLDLSIPD